jgi:hypothetical protein
LHGPCVDLGFANYESQQAVVERVCDENLEQGARYVRWLLNHLNSRVFVENFAAQILQPPQCDQGWGVLFQRRYLYHPQRKH